MLEQQPPVPEPPSEKRPPDDEEDPFPVETTETNPGGSPQMMMEGQETTDQPSVDPPAGRSRIEQIIEERLGVLPGQLSQVLGEGLRGELEAAQQRADESLDELRTAVSGLEDRLSTALSGVTEATQVFLSGSVEAFSRSLRSIGERIDKLPGRNELEALQRTLDGEVERLRAEVEMLRGLPDRVGEGIRSLRDALASVASAEAQVQQDIRQLAEAEPDLSPLTAAVDRSMEVIRERLGESVGEVRWEVGEAMTPLKEAFVAVRQDVNAQSQALNQAMARVEDLAGAMQRLGKRRALQDLVKSEGRLRADQQAWEERLATLETKVGEFGAELRQRLKEAVEGSEELRGALIDEASAVVTSEMQTTLSEFRAQVEQLMGSKAVTNALKEANASSRELLTTTADLRAEVAGLAERIGGWGKPRTATRLAKDVKDLEERVLDAEEAVQGTLVDEVWERMQELLDKRFDEVMRLVEARIQQLTERRGIFGRRGV
jgi:predicted  nucleic acid-binding Zn-ribbon protein